MRFRRTDLSKYCLLLLVSCLTGGSRAHAQFVGAKLDQARTYAFLVGCAEYDKRELRPLTYTVRDVEDFQSVLLGSGVPPENIVLMHDQQSRNLLPEAKKIREQLDLLLARVDRKATLIIALSGHGVQFEGQSANYFCPLDANLQDPATLLPLNEIYRQLEGCPAERKLLLVDACRNNPESALAKSRAVVDLASVSRPQEDRVPQGIVALFSCSAGQQSYEHPTLKHGVFFYQMLRGWKGAADANRDASVTLDEVLSYTKLKTEAFAHAELGAKQIPHLKGDFSGTWVLQDVAKLGTAAARPDSEDPWRSSLTGVWKGTYYYQVDSKRQAVNFTVILVQEGADVVAFLKEPNTFGDARSPYLYATCRGTFQEDTMRLSFTKTYDGTAEVDHDVHYVGRVSSDGAKLLNGAWKIREDWGGAFSLEKDTSTHAGMMAGLWSGTTTYPAQANRGSEKFLMMVVHRGSEVTGFIKQRDAGRQGADAWRHATVRGRFDPGSQQMTFTKTFDAGAAAGIDYAGHLSEDRNQVYDGAWQIPGSFTGGFQLERSPASR